MADNRALLPVCIIHVVAITATNYAAGIQDNMLHIHKLKCLRLEKESTLVESIQDPVLSKKDILIWID